MPKKLIPIFPKEQKVLTEFGVRIRLARLRRHISTETMAGRAACSRMTLHKAEQGSPSVAFGTYVRILAALHLMDDIDLLARDDHVGRRLQDLAIQIPKRIRKAKTP
jgi:transcriptional regulator with XRE-family HTH domain